MYLPSHRSPVPKQHLFTCGETMTMDRYGGGSNMLREIGRRKSCRRLRINSFWEDIERDFAASLAAGVRVANVFGLGLRECFSGQ